MRVNNSNSAFIFLINLFFLEIVVPDNFLQIVIPDHIFVNFKTVFPKKKIFNCLFKCSRSGGRERRQRGPWREGSTLRRQPGKENILRQEGKKCEIHLNKIILHVYENLEGSVESWSWPEPSLLLHRLKTDMLCRSVDHGTISNVTKWLQLIFSTFIMNGRQNMPGAAITTLEVTTWKGSHEKKKPCNWIKCD